MNIAPGGKRPLPYPRPSGLTGHHSTFLRWRGDRRVTDVGIHFDRSCADNRLGIPVVDVGGQSRARGDFITHEFRGDVLRQARRSFPMLVAQYFTRMRSRPMFSRVDGDEPISSDDPRGHNEVASTQCPALRVLALTDR